MKCVWQSEEVSDKDRANFNMACLLHLAGFVERGDSAGALAYVRYVRSMLRLIDFVQADSVPEMCPQMNTAQSR